MDFYAASATLQKNLQRLWKLYISFLLIHFDRIYWTFVMSFLESWWTFMLPIQCYKKCSLQKRYRWYMTGHMFAYFTSSLVKRWKFSPLKVMGNFSVFLWRHSEVNLEEKITDLEINTILFEMLKSGKGCQSYNLWTYGQGRGKWDQISLHFLSIFLFRIPYKYSDSIGRRKELPKHHTLFQACSWAKECKYAKVALLVRKSPFPMGLDKI